MRDSLLLSSVGVVLLTRKENKILIKRTILIQDLNPNHLGLCSVKHVRDIFSADMKRFTSTFVYYPYLSRPEGVALLNFVYVSFSHLSPRHTLVHSICFSCDDYNISLGP
jgi:hypothetical protein